MKITKIFLPLLVAGLFTVTSCSRDNDNVDINNNRNTNSKVKDAKYVDATAFDKWTYYSLSEGKVVATRAVGADISDLSWDIAFHIRDVKLNGGLSGSGKGEAIDTQSKDWNAITQAPTTGYTEDEKGEITVKFDTNTFAQIKGEDTFNKVLSNKWVEFRVTPTGPGYTLSHHIYIIKTADGKYAKIHFYDNKDAKDKSNHISFKYQLSSDGKF